MKPPPPLWTIRAQSVVERVLSQIDAHRPFGGVVPEIAARNHVAHLDRLIEESMAEAGASYSELDCVAATAGPGPDRRTAGRGHDGKGNRRSSHPSVSSDQPSGSSHAGAENARADRISLFGAVDLWWTLPIADRPGCRTLRTTGDNDRRRGRRSLRQNRQNARARLSRRAGDRDRRGCRRSRPLPLAATADRSAWCRFFVLRAQNGRAAHDRQAPE